MSNSIVDSINQLLPARRRTNSVSGWTSFNAVCCHHNGESADSRGRGGIITNGDGGVSYSCFNCNFRASYVPGRHLTYKFRKLLSWLGADENTIRRLVIEAIRVRELSPPEAMPDTDVTVEFAARPLPAEAQSFQTLDTFYILNGNQNVPEQWHDAILYTAARRVDLRQYDFYWTPETAYNLHRRVIIPFTWNHRIVGYTARALYDEVRPKYYSQIEPNYVFNLDRQLPTSRFVIVCEGPFDAMAVDGVAVLSNSVSEPQADIIDSLGRQVIVVPDFDRAGSQLIDHALEYGWDVSFPIWQENCKDISQAVANYGKLFVLKAILDAAETSRLKIELRRRSLYTNLK